MNQELERDGLWKRVSASLMSAVRRLFSPKSGDAVTLACHQAFFAISPDAMLVTDGPKVVALNKACAEMMGYDDPEVLIGRDINDFTPQSMKGRFENIYQLDASGPYVLELIRKDGSVFLTEVVGKNVYEFGRHLRVAVIHDLSEDKKGVEPIAFAQSEKRFHQVFNASPSVLTISTVREGVHLEVNKAWEQLVGIDRDYALGRTSAELGIWHSLEDRARFVDEIDRHGRVSNFVTQFNVKGGEIATLAVSAEPIVFDGTDCMVLSGFDVTDRIRADNADQMIRIESEKTHNLQSKFLSNISHELRNPLNTIVGFSSGLADGIWGRLDDERHQTYVEAIKASGENLVGIIDDLLDMARLEGGQMPYYYEPIDVASIIRAVEGEMRPVFEEAGIELSVNVGLETSPALLDQSRTKQALLNILINALRYTARGGEVHVHLYETAERLNIVMEDNGVGVMDKDVGSIFEPFSGNFIPRDDDGMIGSRLGMPLAKGLIEAQGGQIELKSMFGEGTRVVVTLPIIDPPAGHLD